MKRDRLAAALAAAVVACAVLAGLYFSGSPGEQRLLRLDERRAQDLWAISNAIEGYWDRTGELPLFLEDVVVGGMRLSEAPLDPATGEPYEYDPIDLAGFAYVLCADFARASEETSRADFWRHEAGRSCFSLGPEMSIPHP